MTLRDSNKLYSANKLCLLLAMASFAGHAGRGTGSTGGGNAVGGSVFDFYENQGTSKIQVSKLPAYVNVLSPKLEQLSRTLPDYATLLREGMSSKTWMFETKPLDPRGCLNDSIILVEREVVGCQTTHQVRIYKPWFDSVDEVNQAGLISHELLIVQVLKLRKSREHQSELEMNAREINRALFSTKLPESYEFQRFIQERQFGLFATSHEKSLAQNMRSKAVDKICLSKSLDVFNQEHAKILNLATDGIIAPALRVEYFKIAKEIFDKVYLSRTLNNLCKK